MFHPVGIWWAEELAVLASNIFCWVFGRGADAAPLEARADPVSYSYPVGVSAGLKSCAGGGTYGAGRVAVGEAHAFRGEAVDRRGAVVVTPLAGQVHPPHVVDKDDNDIGMICCLREGGEASDKKKEREKGFHILI